ncbi:hypothetical protein P3638_14530 [Vibrio parahaemolyticus]|uniref:hypothetical protein n=1 Tax=Vibrio parahaemolyticus TaxID=670 RepID=UPI001A288382|nr:hypothetical protein [Vibrio parahaemolyticus]MDF4288801.1 hypothetical protein [Vibrio parahaemolyticus]MDF5293656.1 hypothetical protein [Vibrio parahaemolyticus]MDF5302910.1 hypothetical protein [Vibrio parahaemolyticus]MDG2574131.1 hypothetical protein [Vibrio parahaemolyticus]MDG2716700.1 hypothetical protein [Vibrio parahaemolyticus]
MKQLNNNDTSVPSITNKNTATALYLDGLYVADNVLEQVIDSVKQAGLLPKNCPPSDKQYQWVANMTEHHRLILNLQNLAREHPYRPVSMKCLDKHIQEQAHKVCKIIADRLSYDYPPQP